MANTLVSNDLVNAGNVYPTGLRFNVLTGTTADTNIAVTGIATTDKILCATRFDRTSAGATLLTADLTSEIVILSAGNIQVTDTNTTGDKIWLWWYDKTGGTNVLGSGDLLNAANTFSEGLRFTVAAGAGAAANIAISGIETTDKLLQVLRINRDATAATVDWADDTANCSITSAGNIQSSTNLTGDSILVMWYDKTGGTPLLSDANLLNVVNPFPVGLTMSLVAGDTATTNIPVTGIATTDTILFAMAFIFDPAAVTTDGSAANFDNVTDETTITSAGNIQLATLDSTGCQILVIWYNKA